MNRQNPGWPLSTSVCLLCAFQPRRFRPRTAEGGRPARQAQEVSRLAGPGRKLSSAGYRPLRIPHGEPARRRAALARALAASTSRFLGGAAVTRASTSIRVSAAICSTARSKAARLAPDGREAPMILRTYCRAAAWTSSSVAGGSKLWRVRMLRHMAHEVNERSERSSLGVGNHLGTISAGHDQQALVLG